jgi:Na+-translocating ferredoxin:NAD+ oxidoreductase RNF subunit RnfB
MEDTLVQPLFEREPDSVAGPFYVIRHQCIICGLPPNTAPKNISWSKETFKRGCENCTTHCRIEKQPETPEELAQVIEAAEGSCVKAIRYCGTDPKILAKFKEIGLERLCDALNLG